MITDVENIKTLFANLKNIEDLAELLNHIDPKPKNKITAKKIAYLSISKDSRYKECIIPKKNGGERFIHAPDHSLKRVQFAISRLFQIIFSDVANHNSNGFLDGRNIVRNAEPHINKKYVLNMDLNNFFPSIEFRRVKTVLELNPFCLNGEKERLAFVIANIVTYKNFLQQGAPTSPIISNIVTQKLDRKLTRICKEKRIKYSRYADDLTFSSNKAVFNPNFIQAISILIQSENFTVNENKTRIRTSMDRQEVTGLVVNRKVNIKREYLSMVRAMLNNWEKGGLAFAQSKYNIHKKKIDLNIDFKNALRGHIDFIGLVKGKESLTYTTLKQKYEYMFNRIDFDIIKHLNVREKLIADNRKMEMILVDNIHSSDDKFISFCTCAFHQIENLLNYYYHLKFSNIDDLKRFMFENNPAFNKRWKSLDKITGFKRVRDYDINLFVYLFEKEHYFDKGIYYNGELTLLREIRNDESHRCSIILSERDNCILEYERIKAKWEKYKAKHNKPPIKEKAEQDIEFKIKLFDFMDSKNYMLVRNIIKSVLKSTNSVL